MRFGIPALLAVSLCAGVLAQIAAAQTTQLRKPAPGWYTPDFATRIHDAGPAGIQIPQESLNVDCPGYQQKPGVSAAGCIVAPFGCTANFVFTDGASSYIGTARHCVGEDGNDVGEAVVMQVDSTTVAEVGTVAKHTSGEGDPGNDFALVKIHPDVAGKWGVNPEVPAPVGGPQGIFAGCDPQGVKYYGHGYVAVTAQGKPEGGFAYTWGNDGYGWLGIGAPGDSGSPVLTLENHSAGNFTHIIISDKDYLSGSLVGMRTTAILQFLGPGYALVNADGSTATSPAASCTDSSGGGGKGGGKGNGGKGNGGKGKGGKH